jgi:hypothetical protein
VPAATPVANPVALIVAVAGVPELQVTWLLTSLVEPLLSVAIATNCCVPATAIDGVAGVTAIVFTLCGSLLEHPANNNAQITAKLKIFTSRCDRIECMKPPGQTTAQLQNRSDARV